MYSKFHLVYLHTGLSLKQAFFIIIQYTFISNDFLIMLAYLGIETRVLGAEITP